MKFKKDRSGKSKLKPQGMQEYREPRSGEEKHKLWLNRIETALDVRERHKNGSRVWTRMYDLYKGEHWTDAIDPINLSSEMPRTKITVNKCKSVVNDNLAFIVQADPKFMASPKRSEDVITAKIQGEWLNSVWPDLEINDPIVESLADWLICGFGVVKTGFTFGETSDFYDYAVKSPKLDGVINYADNIRDEKPYVYRISPKQFLWDFTVKFNNSRWCCEVLYKTREDVFANKNYNQAALDELRTGSNYAPKTVVQFLREDDTLIKRLGMEELFELENDNERIVLYEIWDKKYQERLVYIAGIPIPLVEDVWPYDYLLKEGLGFPYRMITLNDINDEPFPQGIIQAFEDQQYELNRKRTADYAHRRRFNRKYGVVENSVSPEDIKLLSFGGDGAIIKMKSQGDIFPIPDAAMSNDNYNIEQLINNDIRELTGADALLSGGRLPSRTSASEISARSSVQTTKLSMYINKADKFITSIGYMILSHSRANITEVQAIERLGSLGKTWEEFAMGSLPSKITLKLEYSTSKPYNEEMEKNQRMGVLDKFVNLLPLFQQGGIALNVVELFKWALEPFDIKDITRFFPEASVIQPTLPFVNNAGQKGQAPSANPMNQMQPPQDPMQSMISQQGAMSGGGLNSQMLGQLMGGGA